MFLVKAVTASILNAHQPMQNTVGNFQVPQLALVINSFISSNISKYTCPFIGGIDEFGYVEFNGKGGRTCPTCKGTGRIAKGT